MEDMKLASKAPVPARLSDFFFGFGAREEET